MCVREYMSERLGTLKKECRVRAWQHCEIQLLTCKIGFGNGIIAVLTRFFLERGFPKFPHPPHCQIYYWAWRTKLHNVIISEKCIIQWARTQGGRCDRDAVLLKEWKRRRRSRQSGSPIGCWPRSKRADYELHVAETKLLFKKIFKQKLSIFYSVLLYSI